MGRFTQYPANSKSSHGFFPAEYCAPAWCRSSHWNMVDTQLHEAMRTVNGCTLSTPLNFLPCLSGIEPPKFRREKICKLLYYKADDPQHLLHEILYRTRPPSRLKSRNPLLPYLLNIVDNDDSPPTVPNGLQPYFSCFSNHPPGCEMPRKPWVQLNRLRSGFGRFKSFMHKIGISDTNLCTCGSIQTAHHILNSCTALRPPCDLTKVEKTDLINYLSNTDF